MANRRMFSLQIVDTDAFLEMPVSSQLLYFHLVMRADDEGFVGSPRRIMKTIGVQDDDLKVLIAKRFVLTFESGIVVIKHWLIHNTIRMDRFKKTTYQDERKTLTLKENNSYTTNGNQTATSGMRKLSKDKLIEVNISKDKLSKLADKSAEQGSQKTKYIEEYSEKEKILHKQIIEIMMIFRKINPTLNMGNKTQRTAVKDLISQFGYDRVKQWTEFAISIQGRPYAPTITTPYNLFNKIANLKIFHERESQTMGNSILDLDAIK